MSFTDFCNIVQLDFNGVVIDSAVRKNTIWILRDNFELIIYQTNDLTKFNNYSFNPVHNVTPKLYVDDDGEKCVILLGKAAPLYFTLSNPIFCTLEIKKNFPSTCGCWVKRKKELPAFLVGSEKGIIAMLVPGSNRKPSFVFNSGKATPIHEISCTYNETQSFIYMYMESQLYCFHGNRGIEQIELMFADGPSKHFIPLVEITEQGKDRIVQLHDSNSIGIIMDDAALVLKPETIGSSFNLHQDLYEIDSKTISTFALSIYGTLFSDSTGIPITLNQKLQLTVPLPDVNTIYVDEFKLLFITSGNIIEFEKQNFMKYLCQNAISDENYEYAQYIMKEDFSIINQIISSISKEDAIRLLSTFSIPLDIALNLFTDNSIKLAYFTGFFKRIHPKWKKQKYCIAIYILQLFCSIFPDKSNEFQQFLKDNYTLFEKQYLYKKVNELGWREGRVLLAELFEDNENTIDLQFLENNKAGAISTVSNPSCPISLVTDTLLRLGDEELVSNFIINHKYLKVQQLFTILSVLPKPAAAVIGSHPYFQNTRNLLIISYCLNNDTNNLARIVKESWCDLDFEIRTCLWFKLYTSAALGLIQAGKPKQALQCVFHLGLDETLNLIHTRLPSHKQKEAYLYLLQLIDENNSPKQKYERERVIDIISSSNLFSFEELLPFIPGDELLFNFGSRIKENVTKIQIPKEETIYSSRFRPPKDEFVLKLQTCCDHCHKQLVGTEFARFPCGHIFHVACLKDSFIKLNESVYKDLESSQQNDNDLFTKSCPICGFSSISQCTESFKI